jgi:hypothetical protein
VAKSGTRVRILASIAAIGLILTAPVIVGGSSAVTQTDASIEERLARLECEVFGENCPQPTPTPTPTETEPPVAECIGQDVAAGANLHNVVDGKSGTFCLAPGTYNVGSVPLHPGVGAVLQGVTGTIDPGAAVKVDAPTKIEGTAQAAIIEAADSVILRWLDITGSRPGDACIPACGRGVSPADNVTIEYTRIHHNSNQAVGGAGPGLQVRFSQFDHNGSADGANGCCSGGIKSVYGFAITDSFVHDNIGNGIWCDRECTGDFVAGRNLVAQNERNGIAYEVSGGPAKIFANFLERNNLEQASDKGGLKITASKNVEVFGNTLKANFGHSIRVGGDPRLNKPAGDGRGYVLENIYLHDNYLAGHAITGCDLSGVVCERND